MTRPLVAGVVLLAFVLAFWGAAYWRGYVVGHDDALDYCKPIATFGFTRMILMPDGGIDCTEWKPQPCIQPHHTIVDDGTLPSVGGRKKP